MYQSAIGDFCMYIYSVSRRLHNFREWLPGGCATSALIWPEVAQFPGIVIRKLQNLLVPENFVEFCQDFIKETVAWDFQALVFHESIVHKPLRNPSKYFQKYFVFVEIFTQKGFFHRDFWVTISRGCATSRLRYPEFGNVNYFLNSGQQITVVSLLLRLTISGDHNPEVVQLLGDNIWRLHNFQVSLPRSYATFGLQYLEIVQFPGIVIQKWIFAKKMINFLILNSYKSFKTEYIYKNHIWLIGTCLGLWFEGKKVWGLLRIIFAISGYRYLEV